MKYMLSINLLTEKVNWVFETLDSNNLAKESQPDFGHLDNKEMIKTVLLLEEYAKCVSKWNNKAILTLTGPIFVIPKSSEEETRLRGRVKSYTVSIWGGLKPNSKSVLIIGFNNSIKQPPITQFYQVIFIKYENKKYCADIIFTEAKTKIKIFDTNKEDYCGKSSIDNWEYKDYVKDSKLMEQIFENKLRFLEWYIGFELVELINAAGIEGISDLVTRTESNSKPKHSYLQFDYT
uniref:Decapping nuclease n=1 Tax=Meloidogyne javanica TaxID=6303 RepID=A0A915MVT9_MELJA